MMPTFSNIFLAKSRAATPDIFLWRCRVSIIWLPMVNDGLRLVIGSWKIIPILLPRTSDISRSEYSRILSPPRSSALTRRIAFFGNKSIIAKDVSDLPQPDSPRIHKVSPRSTCKLTSSTAWRTPVASGISTVKFSTFKTRSDKI